MAKQRNRIFFCYRREDAKGSVGRLYERLTSEYGADGVFRDIDDIPPSVDFRTEIEQALKNTDIVVAVIGPRWLEILQARVNEPNDFPRLELEAAHRLERWIIPVLVDDAAMPGEADLPASLQVTRLSYLNAVRLRHDPDFSADFRKLAKTIQELRAESRRFRRIPEDVMDRLGIGLVLISLVTIVAAVVWGWKEQAEREREKTLKEQLAREVAEALPEMVKVPGGRFDMGSRPDERGRTKDEGPPHKVWITPFMIGKYEVTFEEYDFFAEKTGRDKPQDEGWGRERRPVTNVSWSDATEYASWLAEQTGDNYRLPTEAEWEYAARAMTKTPFSTGPCISGKEANIKDSGEHTYDECPASGIALGQTQGVGSYPPNDFDLHDMHGNVREWVEDCWHEDYQRAPTDGSAWLNTDGGHCGGRVLRGGSWIDFPEAVRSAYRSWNHPVESIDFIGFRLARDL